MKIFFLKITTEIKTISFLLTGFLVLTSCVPTPPDQSCTPGSISSCPITNGVGTKTCNSDGLEYGPCTIASCDTNFHFEADACLSNTKVVSIANGSGAQTWNPTTSSYNAVVATSCHSGFILSSNSCIAQTCTPGSSASCTIGNGVGSKICNSDGSGYGSCTLLPGNLPSFSVTKLSNVELAFDNRSASTLNVYDPRKKQWVTTQTSDALTMDSPPPMFQGGMREFTFAFTRCSVNTGFHLNPSQVMNAITSQGWCHSLFSNPWSDPIAQLPLWSLATRAAWDSRFITVNNNQGQLAVLGFTENKTMLGTDATNRILTNFVEYKMDGNLAYENQGIPNSLGDGFYQGFVTIGKVASTQANGWGTYDPIEDLGPIVWPRHGYRSCHVQPCSNNSKTGWKQASIGFRHPHGFVWDNNYYVYYAGHEGHKDSGYDGFYVARSPLSSGLLPGTFQCGSNFNLNCLPSGYNKANFRDSLSLEGPNARPILPVWGPVSFSVARLKGTNYFLGVQETYADGVNKIQLRLSTDLVNWGPPVNISGLTYQGVYENGPMHMPMAMSLSGENHEVEADGFYIIGTAFVNSPGWPNNVHRIKVSLQF